METAAALPSPDAAALPSLESLPNAQITFELVCHPSFPPPSASLEEVAEFIFTSIDDTNEVPLHYGICEVPILSPFGVALLGARTAPLIGQGGAGVGSMHMGGSGSDILALFPRLLKELGERLAPLFALLYRPPGAPLPELHMFSAHCIAYGTGPSRETALKLHTDASLFTATICVRATPDLRGTELVFHGAQGLLLPRLALQQARYALARRQSGVDVKNGEDGRNHVQKLPRAGHALLHLGAHPHRTLPVEAGERMSWVLWWHGSERGGAAGAAAAAAAEGGKEA